MTHWIAILTERIRQNLSGSPISEAAKQEIVDQAVEDTEAGRPFNYVEPEESKPRESQKQVIAKPKKGRKESSLDSQFATMMEKMRKEEAAKLAVEKLKLDLRRWGGWESPESLRQ